MTLLNLLKVHLHGGDQPQSSNRQYRRVNQSVSVTIAVNRNMLSVEECAFLYFLHRLVVSCYSAPVLQLAVKPVKFVCSMCGALILT